MVNQDAPIAIVEDNAPIRKLFATVLGKKGFKTMEFGTAEEAINGLKESEC